MNKIIYALLSFFLACGFQSCANDEKEVFDKSASERMSEALATYSDILQAPKNGWLLKYYAGTEYSYGGYNMIVSFANGKVTAASEIASSDAVYHSSYALVSDQGPVLTFNTYNPILHYFGSPSYGSLDGYQGDFEFVIMSASADSIVLKGKKWANKMVMTPMPKSMNRETYLDSIVKIEDENPYIDYKGVVDNKNVKLSFSDSWHSMSVEVGDAVVSTPVFIYSSTGITFHTPVDIAGHSFESLTWNATDTIFSGKAVDGTLGSFKVYISPEYKKYLGAWSVDINGTLYSMLVSENIPGQSFIVSGPELPFPFVVIYNSADDKISITTQTVGEYNGNIVKLCPWEKPGGYFTWTDGIGLESKIISRSPLKLTFSDNGVWSSYTVSSYILYMFDSADNRIGVYSGGIARFPYINGAVKVN